MESVLGAAFAVAVGTIVAAPPASAQDAAPTTAASPAVYLADSASPFGAPDSADAAKVTMPALAFTPQPEDAGNYDKYYYFHRPDTDFATAYADIRECDGYARGLTSGIGYAQVPYPYAGTMAGAVGGALGNLMAAAIFGSGEKRRLRRVNMRTCMHFKGYERYGLSKALWNDFNFEEGLSGVSPEERTRALQQQALVASSAQPQQKGLGL
ncbi:hypothetical protein ACG3SL_10660 [Sphingomonas sp. CJ20]